MIGGTHRAKILVVDDEAANIVLINEILQDDYEVVFCVAPEKAMPMAMMAAPDLILLDIMMPKMDGRQLCVELKKDSQTQSIPIIFITALTDEQDETQCFSLGAVDYITKPIRPAVMRARVRTHLDLKRQHDFLANLSNTDGLTGIANRRRFQEAWDVEWRRSYRAVTRMGILMMDIDYFKRFNDGYGHLAGDECLKMVAQTLGQSLARPADLVARYGGEEFICLLPETDLAGLALLAGIIQEKMKALAIVHEYSEVAAIVTISMGGVTFFPREMADRQMVLHQVDNLLYEAKGNGRNRVCLLDLKDCGGLGEVTSPSRGLGTTSPRS